MPGVRITWRDRVTLLEAVDLGTNAIVACTSGPDAVTLALNGPCFLSSVYCT